jgi:NAD(P)-dependent dehydrogenase (short-subunit alcohol dehydrogenase family)
MSRLSGKRILVTGAGGGLGRAISERLLGEGAAVVATDHDEAALRKNASALGKVGEVTPIGADLLEDASIEALAAEASRDGGIDGLVNCAGLYPNTPIMNLGAAEWDQVLGLNLRAPFLLTKALIPAMRERGGAVVNISSTASVLARPGIAHYGASKAGLSQLTRVLAVELAPFKIRVNAVLPGVIATERVMSKSDTPEAAAEMRAKVARIPQRRLGEPNEVAPLVAYLLSDEASYVTGALMTVDGGFSLGIATYGADAV